MPKKHKANFGGHVVKAFVIYTEPGKCPATKGPFSNDDQIENMLLELPRSCESGTVYLVAKVTHCHDLWIETARDFLTVLDRTTPSRKGGAL
jgi:hypothetical protein